MTTLRADGTRAILVPVDLRGVDRQSLELLVAIAAAAGADLLALLVEDPTLEEAARLPFVREILGGSGVERDFHPETLQSRRRGSEGRFEALLREVAGTRAVNWRLQRTTGARVGCALAVARHHVFLPAASRSSRGPASGRIRVVVDGDHGVLEVAAGLAAAGRYREIVVSGDRGILVEELENLTAAAPRVLLDLSTGEPAERVAAVLARPRCDLLVLARSLLDRLPSGQAEVLLGAVPCPLLVVDHE